MLLPRELDPVEAARNVPLPPERPAAGFFAQLGVGNMIDPTVEEVPLPQPKPSAAVAAEPEPKPKSKTRRMR